MLKIGKIVMGSVQTNCYFLYQEDEKKIIVVDPADRGEYLYNAFKEAGLEVAAILLTHAHFDHIGAVESLKVKYNIPVYVHNGEIENSKINNNVYSKLPSDCNVVSDNDILSFNNIKIKCIYTPGHSKGGMCFLIEDNIFTGDTLFQGSIGRTDFISGDYDTLINSIEEKLMVLDKNTKVYPGHGPSSTIIYERMRNPFLN